VIPVPMPAAHGVRALVGAEGSLDRETAPPKQILVGDLTTVVAAGCKIKVTRKVGDGRHARGNLAAYSE
jgi:hypothetical protein